MDELVRKADVLQMLHRMGGTGAKPETFDDGWDQAVDVAYENVNEMDAIDPAEIENRDAILEALLDAIKLTSGGKNISHLFGLENCNGEKSVVVWYQDGSDRSICVNADTGLGLIREVVDALMETTNDKH